jgi:hydrogenase-4 membrane subunit HyfE
MMLTNLFIVTIVYEVIQSVIMAYRLKKRIWSQAEEEMMPDEDQRIMASGVAFLCNVLFILAALFGALLGGNMALMIAAVFTVLCAFGTAMYVFSYGRGRNISILWACYNLTMMILFVWCICKGIQ